MKTVRALLLVTLAIALTSFASAQGGYHGRSGGSGSFMGGGMRGSSIAPPGMWWKNSDLVTKLSITTDQQKRMDDILEQSRIQLVHIKATLEEDQILLEPMLNANPPDSTKTLAQIGKIADTRAELEKANAKMLLGIRGVLTADQWTKLQVDMHARRDSMRNNMRSRDSDHRGGPDGPRGPRGGPGSAPPANPPAPPPPAE